MLGNIFGNMREEEASKFISKKSYEISYALCRVSSKTNSSLSFRLEGCAFSIIESATNLDVAGIRNFLNLAKNYVRIGSDASILHKMNADLILQEISRFDSFLLSLENMNLSTRVNFDASFSPWPTLEYGEGKKRGNSGYAVQEKHKEVSQDDRQSSADRQSAILALINKSGICRMKDLLDKFSSTSERTLRYDLQSLVERGVIERVGEGGPGTFYKPKIVTSYPSSPSSQGSPSVLGNQ